MESDDVESLGIAVGHNAMLDEALGLEPELVHVGPDEALAVPTKLVFGAVSAAFELVKENLPHNLVVHDRWLTAGISRIGGTA
jgi:hypothetical protein